MPTEQIIGDFESLLPKGPFNEVIKDISMMSCGCLCSEEAAGRSAPQCPQCKTIAQIVGPVEPLRQISAKIAQLKEELGFVEPSETHTLLSLFHSLAVKDNAQPVKQQRRRKSSSTLSNSSTVEYRKNSSSSAVIRPDVQEEKEYIFAKCFPMYRKRFQHSTHQKLFKTKSKLFINTSISPNLKYFALLTETKWEVFGVPEDPSKMPTLVCCGKANGEYGSSFETLKPSDKVQGWQHLFCRLSNNLLVVACTKGGFTVHDIAQQGKPVYSYTSQFPIRCIDVSPDDRLVACGVIGKDRNTGQEQALILFHEIGESEPCPGPVTITLPYRDPINTLQFSQDSSYISCSTALESRFLVISLKNISEPRLVMKSLRTLDTSLESEGITDTKMFNNNHLMCITSVAFNAPPIIINTKLNSSNGIQAVAQPKMLFRVDEVGCQIHRCEVSPRQDSIAFLDKEGTVYIMFSPRMMEQDTRRIVAVSEVSPAYRMREAASMRFSHDGYKLYILDRKGVLYIEDFSAGLPSNHDVIKCKQIN